MTIIIETIWDRPSSPYMSRVKFFGPESGPRLHIFHRGDVAQDMHDHPGDFWTFPLTSYVEQYLNERGEVSFRVVRAGRLHYRKAEHVHRVMGRWSGERWKDGTPAPVWDYRQMATLVWFRKYRRSWGFHTHYGWVRHDIYESRQTGGAA